MKKIAQLRFLVLLLFISCISVYACSPKDDEIEEEKPDPVYSMTHYIEKIRPDFKIGTHFSENPSNKDPYLGFIRKNFNAVTIGVYMKGTQRDGKDAWNFGSLDSRIPFAQEKSMKIKFHPGIGHDTYNPDWLVNGGFSAAELDEILTERFKTLIEKYDADLSAFELVNEAIAPDASGEIWTVANNVWTGIGWSAQNLYPLYIKRAFEVSDQYTDEVEFILNDNNNSMLESAKSDNFYNAVELLLDQGVPIDGVGLQMHCSVVGDQIVESAFGSGAPLNIESFKQMMEKYGKLGVDVHITEFDVHLPENPDAQDYALQAIAYRDVLKAALESTYCKSFTTWGTADPKGWAPSGYNPHSLWLDDNFQPKENYFKVLEMLQEMAGEI
ncbi:MAG: endo-1,4-beta-xylanase [Cyclobacteriaceae bacterium]|nr:endo-1,4-beta-xylanase [Cyclobacteriaceae bacterium]